MARYHSGVECKTVEAVQQAVNAILAKHGEVEVFIGVYAAFDGCATPIRIRADEADKLTTQQYAKPLRDILGDWPVQTAYVQPIY